MQLSPRTAKATTNHVPKYHILRAFKPLQGWGLHWAAFFIKKCSLISNLNLSWGIVRVFPLVLSLAPWEQSRTCSYCPVCRLRPGPHHVKEMSLLVTAGSCWHSAPGTGSCCPRTCPWHLFLHKHWACCIDKVPAVPFPALPGPEGKHSWHICHVQLNTASFRKEKKNQIKENPVLPLLPSVFFYT